MNIGTFKRRVGSTFGDMSNIILSANDIIDWLNEAQEYVVRETFCLQAVSTASANVFPLTISDLFIVKRVKYGTTPIRFSNLDEIEDFGLNNAVGTPIAYYLNGQAITLWPTPVGTDSTLVTVTYAPAPLEYTTATADSVVLQVPLPYHNDLVMFALARAHEKNENYRAAELKMQEFVANVSHRRYEIQQGDSSEHIIRQDPFDYDI